MLSHFPQSLSTRHHSATSSPSPTWQLRPFTPTHTVLPLGAGLYPTMLTMTVPHIRCYPTVTAPLSSTRTAHTQSLCAMKNPSLVTLYYRSIHMSSLCKPKQAQARRERTQLNYGMHWFIWPEIMTSSGWTAQGTLTTVLYCSTARSKSHM